MPQPPLTSRIRVLIVDDEPLARKRIRRLLQADPEIDVAGECSDGKEALAAIARQSPDLVYLDVQMPGAGGFEVVDALPKDSAAPVIIFVTAYDQYAVRAFEVHAQDYLLKPFDRERFRSSLFQAKQQVARRQPGETSLRLAELLETMRSPRKYLRRLVVKNAGRILFLKTDEIDWIEAADNYVKLHTNGEVHLLRETMHSLEGQLDPERFLRIHRSSIVNVDRIHQLQPWFRGDYLVLLRDGTKLTLSRGYRDRVQNLVGKAL